MGGLPVAIVLIRTVVVFLCILVAMRIMGKRQLGELELSELVVAVLISDMAAHPLQDIGIPLMNGIIPIAVLLCCELLISWLSLKCPPVRKLLFGKPSVLIHNGRINSAEMLRNRFSLDELEEELRSKGVTDPATVKYAILETDGSLTVLLRSDAAPVTAEQLGVKTEDVGLPVTLISDGVLNKRKLAETAHTPEWLQKTLNHYGIQTISEVYYMTIDDIGRIFIQKKEDNA